MLGLVNISNLKKVQSLSLISDKFIKTFLQGQSLLHFNLFLSLIISNIVLYLF